MGQEEDDARANVRRELDELRTAVGTVATKYGEQSAEIRRLSDIIAAGGSITAGDLNAVADEMDAIAKPLEAIASPPPPEPAP